MEECSLPGWVQTQVRGHTYVLGTMVGSTRSHTCPCEKVVSPRRSHHQLFGSFYTLFSSIALSGC